MEKETYRKAKEILDKYDPTRSKPVEVKGGLVVKRMVIELQR